MKPVILCFFLLSGCFWSDYSPITREFALTWTCLSPEGCERAAEVERIDRIKTVDEDCEFTSTRDPTFAEDATIIITTLLPGDCSWLYFLSLFGHELERSKLCYLPGGFDLELAIPNEDPTTFSMWLVKGRDMDLF